ncbi:P-loop containing nucleoside triphosphate hydrolase protein [Rhizodiscina lignyota]|uniref:P-loop containing nucleoside triphosphate hydrolase protein n=1 Tax=Rhizodiscina lignyota TaxID=1504668 RepID=A0A9P4M1Q3_9PEZI|nr:P-loop containing nucleoside triphosphate hydrolase protein [Rhizodiscina lignyota]
MARSIDYSSDEESTPQQNGIKTVTLSGKAETNGVDGEVEEAEAPTPLDPKEIGMQCGYKNLYSGKEDRRGRFQWQDTVPTDVGKPAEDAETAKWALLVRNVKVYSDPRKVLAIHSIVVQSPLLKKLLGGVLKDYPGVTVGLRRLEFSGKFEPLIHRWSELEDAIKRLEAESESDDAEEEENRKKTKEHTELLYNLLHKEFKTLIEESQDMMRNGVITYEYLWTVFQPGHVVYTRQDGQDTALKLHNTRYGTDRNMNPCFWVSGKYVDWDGSRFGTNKLNLCIYPYAGTRKIGVLAAYPIDYHLDKDGLKERLIERGGKIEALAGSHYKAYHGVAWNRDPFGNKDKHNIKGRIVIDTYGWNKFNPNWSVFVTPLNQKEQSDGQAGDDDDDGDDMYDPGDEGTGGGMPVDGMFADEEGGADRIKLTAEQKLICTPLLRGYALKNKQWLNFFVNSVKEIEWSVGAFDSLVLPSNQKELILGFTESQRKNKEMFDDVIEGKGKGIILLLCGPPGVGKTLTAESVAEEMRVPLYMMSAGDLGLDPRNIENKLNNILEMCTKWNAILLLDEADVFLEQRSLHELERNKLVSIFLRILEYYEGIMFLTTNRVNTFDAAFQSRIHISLDYPELSIDSRRMIWKNFLAAAKAQGQDNSITDIQLERLALMDLNGRQIKNILKTGQLLARRRDQTLCHDHIVTVLDVTQHLHNETRETERARSSIFC